MEKGELHLLKPKRTLPMMHDMVNFKKTCFILKVMFFSFQASLEVESKNGFFRQNRWRFNRKVKCLIVFALITVMLVSIFAFMPKQNESKTIVLQTSGNLTASPSEIPIETNNPKSSSNILSGLAQAIGEAIAPSPSPKPPGLIASAQTINSTVWLAVAANAWKYFQPGVGLDSTTGLPYAGPPILTDWDLGVYVQAVIDAQKIGLIDTNGTWGFNARMDKVLTFLETRPLNVTTNYPFQFYQANDGGDYHELSDLATAPIDGADTGRLFVALNNVRVYNSSWALRIDNFVYNVYGNRSNYATLLPNIKSDTLTSTSIYAYYIYSGFASFWPNNLTNVQSTILNNIFSRENVTIGEGVSLPKAEIICEPLLCSVFELNNNDSRLMSLAYQVYLAHAAYYNATGQYRAFSEGASLANGWEYEYVVLPDGRIWTLDESNSNTSPVIYTKVALSFLALYNLTYARNLSVYLENILPDPYRGYSEGVDESGKQLANVGDLTNGLILGAALYAIQNSR